MSKTKKALIIIGLLLAGYIGFRYTWHTGTIAYFNYKCEKYGGEFINERVDDVNGVLQMRVRNPEDYFDRLRKNDIPEDPYGHTNWEAQNPETLFVSKDRGYSFLETLKPPNVNNSRYPVTQLEENPTYKGAQYWRYSLVTRDAETLLVAENVSTLKSKYGFTWREVRSFWDRLFGVWGGELLIIRLNDKKELAIRKGYFYQNWFSRKMRICPKGKDVNSTFLFVSKVLHPTDLGVGETSK